MPAVLIQVELPKGKRGAYKALTDLMERSGWKVRLASDDGSTHALPEGTFFGSHNDIGKLAAGLTMKIRDSGVHKNPRVFTAVLQDWTFSDR